MDLVCVIFYLNVLCEELLLSPNGHVMLVTPRPVDALEVLAARLLPSFPWL